MKQKVISFIVFIFFSCYIGTNLASALPSCDTQCPDNTQCIASGHNVQCGCGVNNTGPATCTSWLPTHHVLHEIKNIIDPKVTTDSQKEILKGDK